MRLARVWLSAGHGLRRSRGLMRAWLASSILLVALGWTESARAEPSVHGAADGRLLLSVQSRYGGALAADLWAGMGWFRIGGVFGIAALSAGDGASSRVFTPLGLSLAAVPREGKSGPTATLRGGGYAGAQKGGLIIGPFASCALGYAFSLGEGASVRLGVDGWALFMNHTGLFLGPYVGLGF